MNWYIVHESSMEIAECDAFKQEVSLVTDAISTQPAKCLITWQAVPCPHKNVEVAGTNDLLCDMTSMPYYNLTGVIMLH